MSISPNPTSVCVLNCVEDAQTFLTEFGHTPDRWLLVSTHGSVNDYLRPLNITCLELTSLLTDEFIIDAFKAADSVVTNLLACLDYRYAADISSVLGVGKMAYFSPLYRYLGKYEYLGSLKLQKAFETLFERHSLQELVIYRSVPTTFFAGDDLLTGVGRWLAERYGLSLIIRDNPVKNGASSTNNLWRQAVKAIHDPVKAYQKIKGLLLQKSPLGLSTHHKTVLLQEPLYDLEFLKVKLSKSFNVILWPPVGFPGNLPIKVRPEANLMNQISSIIQTMDVDGLIQEKDPSTARALTLLAQNLIKDFQAHILDYLLPLFILSRFHQQNPLDLTVWGNSPIEGSRSLVNDYLLKEGVPVIGMQHGGSYGVQNCQSCHFDSDFSRCTHYLTYGFDEQDLRQTYPDKQTTCKIIPVGSYKEHQKILRWLQPKKKVDILFPLTISLSITLDAFRIKSDTLTDYQLKLLQTLDQFTDLQIVVKPLPGYSDKNCSLFETLKNLEHVTVVPDVTFQEFLKRYQVQAVVIEYPSTPLLEVIGRDIEIFLLADPILPFSQAALDLLKKRVHYFETIEDLQQALIAWKNGDLPSLRNQEFYRQYVFRENTEALILDVITDAINFGNNHLNAN